jgi:predicted nucleic acid-binding protein
LILIDAGVLVALVDSAQTHSARCRATYKTLTLPLVTTWPAFAEAMYLLHRIGGWPLQRILWRHVEEGSLVFHVSTTSEQLRMKALMEQYRDTPMDLADSSLVVAAEALGDKRIFTIDGDFHIYRWNGREQFDVIM